MRSEVDLFAIDVIPPLCSIESTVDLDPETLRPARARFRVGRPRRSRFFRRRIGEELSEWSGWFPIEDGEPIALRWETFWL